MQGRPNRPIYHYILNSSPVILDVAKNLVEGTGLVVNQPEDPTPPDPSLRPG